MKVTYVVQVKQHVGSGKQEWRDASSCDDPDKAAAYWAAAGRYAARHHRRIIIRRETVVRTLAHLVSDQYIHVMMNPVVHDVKTGSETAI